MKKTALAIVCLLLIVSWDLHANEAQPTRPNVLFIAIDDQNDWCGPLGGHPLVKTPNMDRLAQRGTTFTNAHCNAPLCNPSRASLLTGLRPTSTGIYGLSPSFRALPEFADRVTLPQHFAKCGYYTSAAGKIFHGGTASGGRAKAQGNNAAPPDFMVTGTAGGIGIKPPKKLIGATPMGNNPLMDWGSFPHEDSEKGDFQVASWAVDQIKSAPKDKPFFLAAGFFLPHVPCYVTKEWIDLYPNDESVLPRVLAGDRDDTPRFSWYIHWHLPEPRRQWLVESNQWINLARSYLASTSFVDAQIGRILDALNEAGLQENTIVVLWSDHGWHLGEKDITGKNSLWDDGTRVPLIFAGPRVAVAAKCNQPAELLDIYPTLIELCQLEPRKDLEGLSLMPQLTLASTKRERPAITSHNQGNHGIRSEQFRYIRYADGTEEFYDHDVDPNEWHNQIADPKYADVIANHRKWLPKQDRPPAAGSASRVLIYDAATDTAEWEGTKVSRSDPIPQ